MKRAHIQLWIGALFSNLLLLVFLPVFGLMDDFAGFPLAKDLMVADVFIF